MAVICFPEFQASNLKNVEAESRVSVVSPCWRQREMQLDIASRLKGELISKKGNQSQETSRQTVNSHERRKTWEGNKYTGDTCPVIYVGKCFQPNQMGDSLLFP